MNAPARTLPYTAANSMVSVEDAAQHLIWARIPPSIVASDMGLAHVLFEIFCERSEKRAGQIPNDFGAIRAAYAKRLASLPSPATTNFTVH